jgi:hypothetical protein
MAVAEQLRNGCARVPASDNTARAAGTQFENLTPQRTKLRGYPAARAAADTALPE